MALSLIDILTAQQVERPQAHAAANCASSIGSGFKDLLDVHEPKVKHAADNIDKNAPVKMHDAVRRDAVQSPAREVKSAVGHASDAGADIARDVNKAVDSANAAGGRSDDVDTAGAGTAANDAAIAKDDAQSAKISNLYKTLKNLKENGEKLSDADMKLLDELLPQLVAIGVPAGLTAAQVVAGIAGTDKDASGYVDDIMQKMSFAGVDKKSDQTAADLAAQALVAQVSAPVDIKAASKVINAALEEANKPSFQASDLRMLQVASLSKRNKKSEDDDNAKGAITDITGLDITGVQTQGVNLASGDSDAGNIIAANDSHKLQQIAASSSDTVNLFDQKKLDDNLSQQVNVTSQQINTSATPNVVAAERQVVANVAPKNELDAKIGSKPDSDLAPLGNMSSDNFVKFQKMMDDAQPLAKNSAANLAQKQDEIIAQIKFGISGNSDKDERNISIQLHPKELGKVDISMQIGHDGKTHVMVVADNTDTLNLLQKESTSLKDMLSDALKTDSGNLNFSFQERGADDWRQFSGNKNGYNTRPGLANTIPGGEYMTSQSYRYNMIATQGLDIRV